MGGYGRWDGRGEGKVMYSFFNKNVTATEIDGSRKVVRLRTSTVLVCGSVEGFDVRELHDAGYSRSSVFLLYIIHDRCSYLLGGVGRKNRERDTGKKGNERTRICFLSMLRHEFSGYFFAIRDRILLSQIASKYGAPRFSSGATCSCGMYSAVTELSHLR